MYRMYIARFIYPNFFPCVLFSTTTTTMLWLDLAASVVGGCGPAQQLVIEVMSPLFSYTNESFSVSLVALDAGQTKACTFASSDYQLVLGSTTIPLAFSAGETTVQVSGSNFLTPSTILVKIEAVPGASNSLTLGARGYLIAIKCDGVTQFAPTPGSHCSSVSGACPIGQFQAIPREPTPLPPDTTCIQGS